VSPRASPPPPHSSHSSYARHLPLTPPLLLISPLCHSTQAPSQWLFADWKLGSKGIYDAASLANIQKAVTDLDSFADGNANCCLSKPPPGTGVGARGEVEWEGRGDEGGGCEIGVA